MEEEEAAELRNPFPSPPSHYNNYTSQNLKLLALLKERVGDQNGDLGTVDQHEILSDQTDVPSWSLAQLEKPRVDWILEEGHYKVFGDTWFVKETIPSLAELGGHQLYPADPSIDRRPALLAILRSMLVTYSSLTDTMLAPPPPPSASAAPEWQRHVEWITILAQNLMAAANDLRPVQARGNLELVMQQQLKLRREETKNIHSQCDALEARLLELRSSAHEMAASAADQESIVKPSGAEVPTSAIDVSLEDMLRWAEEVT
ncbi:hypothetical protein M405DRAFT_935326 [Rhizopogon salebrosus TDB-379]|nr:hypothetical protein M405DRAFT_935326 [Rhizopogon salebrosus TDB-379]